MRTLMSQALQIQLLEVKEWLVTETAPRIEPLKSKANSMIKGIEERINDTIESSQKILDNSQNEMNKSNAKTYRFARNANKFAESMIGALSAVKISDSAQYQSLQLLCDELEKACANIDALRRSAYPYISPYFIFDRRRLDVFMKRLYDITKELRTFLTSKYADAKAIDDAHTHADKLVQTLNESKQNKERLAHTEERMLNLERQIAETKERFLQVRSGSELAELSKLDQRIRELRAEVKHNMRYLQKPFHKLQSLSRSSEVAIPPHEINKLDEYLNDPLLALETEDNGYPTLRRILRKLDVTIAQGKLKLKSTRLRKAQDQLNSILGMDSLGRLQKQGKEAMTQKRQILSSDTVKTLQSESTRLQEQLETLQKDYELVTSQSEALKDQQAKLKERLENLKTELERKILQLTRKSVQISLSS